MPRPNDSPDVQVSKTLAYILRHGAEKEGLHIRSDGFIKLNDVVGVDRVMFHFISIFLEPQLFGVAFPPVFQDDVYANTVWFSCELSWHSSSVSPCRYMPYST